MNNADSPRPTPDRAAYLEERKGTIEAEHAQAASYDKWLITVASGAFGLSIAFFRFIVPEPNYPSRWVLVAAWLALLLSMTCTLTSFLLSQAAMRRYREILDKRYVKQAAGQPFDLAAHPNAADAWVDRLNISSLVLFILGSFLLALFCVLNVLDYDDESRDSDQGRSPAAATAANPGNARH